MDAYDVVLTMLPTLQLTDFVIGSRLLIVGCLQSMVQLSDLVLGSRLLLGGCLRFSGACTVYGTTK